VNDRYYFAGAQTGHGPDSVTLFGTTFGLLTLLMGRITELILSIIGVEKYVRRQAAHPQSVLATGRTFFASLSLAPISQSYALNGLQPSSRLEGSVVEMFRSPASIPEPCGRAVPNMSIEAKSEELPAPIAQVSDGLSRISYPLLAEGMPFKKVGLHLLTLLPQVAPPDEGNTLFPPVTDPTAVHTVGAAILRLLLKS
jgi:hypothetical protein